MFSVTRQTSRDIFEGIRHRATVGDAILVIDYHAVTHGHDLCGKKVLHTICGVMVIENTMSYAGSRLARFETQIRSRSLALYRSNERRLDLARLVSWWMGRPRWSWMLWICLHAHPSGKASFLRVFSACTLIFRRSEWPVTVEYTVQYRNHSNRVVNPYSRHLMPTERRNASEEPA